MPPTPSPEEVLRKQLSDVDAVGQVSTMAGEEVIYLGHNDPEMTSHATRLTSAFLETDQLSKVLKLGSLQKVVISSFSPSPETSGTEDGISNTHDTETGSNRPVSSSSIANRGSSSANRSSNSASRTTPITKDHIVQSKVVPPGARQDEDDEGDGLITTTAAANLTAALIGNTAMRIATRKILTNE